MFKCLLWSTVYLPRCKFISLGQCTRRLKLPILHPFLSIHPAQTRRETKHTVSLLILYPSLGSRGHKTTTQLKVTTGNWNRSRRCDRYVQYLVWADSTCVFFFYYSLDCFKRLSYYLLLLFWIKPWSTFMLYYQNQNPETLVSKCVWH